jgi:hypothetical protein
MQIEIMIITSTWIVGQATLDNTQDIDTDMKRLYINQFYRFAMSMFHPVTCHMKYYD